MEKGTNEGNPGPGNSLKKWLTEHIALARYHQEAERPKDKGKRCP